MYLLTEWEGRVGKYLARGQDVKTERSEVRGSLPREKYFPVWPDLTQSISILSYDHFFFQKTLCSNKIVSHCFCGAVRVFRPYHSTRTALIRELFSYGFPMKLRAGPHGSYDKNKYRLID